MDKLHVSVTNGRCFRYFNASIALHLLKKLYLCTQKNI